MTQIHVSPRLITMDDVDITDMVAGYTIDAQGRDVPTVVFELKPEAAGSVAVFDGIANVRIGTDAMTVSEFLDGVDVEALEQLALTGGDMGESPIVTAVNVLRGWAKGV